MHGPLSGGGKKKKKEEEEEAQRIHLALGHLCAVGEKKKKTSCCGSHRVNGDRGSRGARRQGDMEMAGE